MIGIWECVGTTIAANVFGNVLLGYCLRSLREPEFYESQAHRSLEL